MATERARRRRRTSVGAASLVVCALGLAACGSDDAEDTAESVLSSPPLSGPVSSANLPARSDEASGRASAAQEALEDGDFSLMANALKLSGLAEEIEKRSTTILSPTDAAFDALGAGKMAELLANREQLRDTVRRHILDDAYSYDELRAMKSVETIDGDQLTITTDGTKVLVAGATVSPPKVRPASGQPGQEVVVLPIDRVLTDAR